MQNTRCGLAQLPHHGAGVFLLLPSAVPGAVVFEKKFKGRQFVDNRSTSACALILPALNSVRTSRMELIMGRSPPPRARFGGCPERINMLDSSSGNVATLS